jgi:hypothetical protein
MPFAKAGTAIIAKEKINAANISPLAAALTTVRGSVEVFVMTMPFVISFVVIINR